MWYVFFTNLIEGKIFEPVYKATRRDEMFPESDVAIFEEDESQ